nr:hypothetical protein [Tanacetum cinerariifolium]
DPEEDPNEEHEPEDEDTKEPSKGSEETESFEEDEIAVTPPPPRHQSSVAAAARVPRSQYNFVDTVEAGHVRGQQTTYETELQECQSAEDLVVTQMMRIYTLEARAHTDTVEDANSSC